MNFLGPIQLIFEQLPIFILVLFRIAGVMVMAPLLGSATIPAKVKLCTALVLALAVFPMVPPIAAVPNSFAILILGVASEMIIGLAMGFVLSLLFLGFQMGAELVGQQMGLSFASLIDPMTQSSSNVLSTFYLLLSTVVYVLLNGHLLLIRSLVDTFHSIPLMAMPTNQIAMASMLNIFIAVLTGAFLLAIRVAGPALIAIFLATLALGFISRTMPQLNILAAGFPIRIALSLILLIASLSAVMWLFQDNLVIAFRCIGGMFMPHPT